MFIRNAGADGISEILFLWRSINFEYQIKWCFVRADGRSSRSRVDLLRNVFWQHAEVFLSVHPILNSREEQFDLSGIWENKSKPLILSKQKNINIQTSVCADNRIEIRQRKDDIVWIFPEDSNWFSLQAFHSHRESPPKQRLLFAFTNRVKFAKNLSGYFGLRQSQ